MRWTLLILLILAAPSLGADEAVVRVRVDCGRPLRAMPLSFLGLSLEKEQMTCGRLRPDNRPLVGMMRLLGRGTLRLGGNSVDRMGPCTPLQVDATLGLARAADWQVIYGLNLGADDPEAAAREARQVWERGRDVVLAFELGNEPDLFVMQHLRPSDWDVAAYLRQFAAHRRLLDGLPLSGPGVGSIYDSLGWVLPFLSQEGDGLAFASVHFYPMVARTPLPPHSPALPTLEHLLSTRIAEALAARLFTPQIQAARERGLPFRVTESNTAARSGQAGVSDVFASALWVVDWTFRLLALGAEGIDVQTDLLNAHDLYTPLLEVDGVLTARPIFYGMLFLGRVRGGSLVTTTVEPVASSLGAYPVAGAGLQVALVNKGTHPLVVTLDAPGVRGSVLRLAAPSIDSRDSVTLGGSAIQADGTWSPRTREAIVRDAGGCWTVPLPAASAALVDLEAGGAPLTSAAR